MIARRVGEGEGEGEGKGKDVKTRELGLIRTRLLG